MLCVTTRGRNIVPSDKALVVRLDMCIAISKGDGVLLGEKFELLAKMPFDNLKMIESEDSEPEVEDALSVSTYYTKIFLFQLAAWFEKLQNSTWIK